MDAREGLLIARMVLLGAGSLMFSACAGGSAMKAQYSQSSVAPVQASKLDEAHLALRYRILPESQFYSKGVDYREEGDTLKVFIKRCGVRETCEPMAANVLSPSDAWQAEVHLPYRGGAVIVVHADGEQQVFP